MFDVKESRCMSTIVFFEDRLTCTVIMFFEAIPREFFYLSR